jgi:hypothetical protein
MRFHFLNPPLRPTGPELTGLAKHPQRPVCGQRSLGGVISKIQILTKLAVEGILGSVPRHPLSTQGAHGLNGSSAPCSGNTSLFEGSEPARQGLTGSGPICETAYRHKCLIQRGSQAESGARGCTVRRRRRGAVGRCQIETVHAGPHDRSQERGKPFLHNRLHGHNIGSCAAGVILEG